MIRLENVSKTYTTENEVRALRHVDLRIGANDLVGILGASGSGKSTLLHLVGLLDQPSAGAVYFEGQDTSRLSDDAVSRLRGRAVGFVFQSFHLVGHLSVLENVELPLFYQGVPPAERRCRARQYLAQVGLSPRERHLPAQLSGGERQRTAIARALVTEPRLILADEPTGNLDSRSGAEIIKILHDLHRDGKAVVIVTHDLGIAGCLPRIVRLTDGVVTEGGARMNAAWFFELTREGARNLVHHKLRSILTLLGVVCGVGAVITMLGIGEGAQRTVLKEIEGLGLNNIIIDSVQPSQVERSPNQAARRGFQLFRYGLTEKDAAQLRAAFPKAGLVTAHLVKQKVYCGSTRIDAKVLGVPPEYFTLFRTETVAGALFGDINNDKAHRVAVLSEPAANSIPVAGGILGRTLRIGPHAFEAIGIVRIATAGQGPLILIPFNTARDLYGTSTIKRETGSLEFTRTPIGQIVLHLEDEKTIEDAAAVVTKTLEANHTAADYLTMVPLDLLRSKQRTQRILNIVLLTIAAISLLVGGIGIMNIMLAVVMERIPEIGTRRALGATRRDIVWQFLGETIVLSTGGGLIGIALGFATVPIASQWTGWPGVITPASVFISLAVTWLVGVIFGIAPAIKAAQMNPVECLRYE